MSSTRTALAAAARAACEALLEAPPLDPARVRGALARVDRAALTPALMALLADGAITASDQELFNEMLAVARRRPTLDALTACVLDPHAEVEARAAAWHAITALDPRAVGRLAPRLAPEVAAAGARRAARVVLIEVECAPEEGASEVRDIVLRAAGEAQRDMLSWFEGERRLLGTPAGLVYGELLAALTPGGELSALIDAALEHDADPAAVAAVEAAAARAGSTAERHRWQARADALRAAALESPRPRPPARAWISGCDGQGAFIVHLEVDRPGGGHAAGELCLRTVGLVRDGWYQATPDLTEMQSVRDELARVTGPWASIEPGAAAALALAVADDDGRVPADLRGALALFRRVYRFGDTPPPAVEPGAAVTVGELVERLREPPFASWFLDGADLDGIDRPLPPSADAPPADRDAWCAATHRAAVEHGLHRLWLDMARNNATWLLLADRPDEAGALAAAARELERDPAGGALGHAIVARTVEVFAAHPDARAFEPGDFDDDFDCPPYHGDRDPDPRAWLAAPETARMHAVRSWLDGTPASLQLDERELSLHCALLVAVETQLASGEPPAVRHALTALLDAGRPRREALVVITRVFGEFVQQAIKHGEPLALYEAMLDRVAELVAEGRLSLEELAGRPRRVKKRVRKRAPASAPARRPRR